MPTLKECLYFAVLGLNGITFHQWLQSTGMQTVQASTTSWIVVTSPVYIALLGWLFLKERLGWRRIAGIGLASLGVLLVITGGRFSKLAGQAGLTTGDLLILISAPNWAIFSVASRWGLKRHPAGRMMMYVMSFGWLLTSLQFLGGGYLPEIGHLTTAGWIAIGFLGIFCSGLAYIFWYDALKILQASQVGVFLYIEPIVTVIVAALLLKEGMSLASLIGGAVILAGIWLVNYSSS